MSYFFTDHQRTSGRKIESFSLSVHFLVVNYTFSTSDGRSSTIRNGERYTLEVKGDTSLDITAPNVQCFQTTVLFSNNLFHYKCVDALSSLQPASARCLLTSTAPVVQRPFFTCGIGQECAIKRIIVIKESFKLRTRS